MSFGGFLDSSSGGVGARIITDIPYNVIPTGAISKNMFNSPGLSLALVMIDP